MHRMHADFTYKSGSTTVSTRVAELLEQPHRRVPGLHPLHGLRTAQPRPGRPVRERLPGHPAAAGQAAAGGRRRVSHAWVGCWIPGTGWLYLDPTNNRLIDASHATVAWGRDYADVTPVKGVIFTEAKKSKMKVSVDMAPARLSGGRRGYHSGRYISLTGGATGVSPPWPGRARFAGQSSSTALT